MPMHGPLYWRSYESGYRRQGTKHKRVELPAVLWNNKRWPIAFARSVSPPVLELESYTTTVIICFGSTKKYFIEASSDIFAWNGLRVLYHYSSTALQLYSAN